MGKKILDSKVLYIFLSIIIAVALWFYVTSLDGNLSEKPIRNIPVTFVGEDILEERGLMITSSTPTVNVTVKATPLVLYKLTENSLRVTVDVSQITEASEYRLAYTVSLPSGVSQSDVEFVSGQTGNVSFTVSRFISREKEIRGKFVGTVAEGYLAGEEDEFIFAPKTITVSGQASMVNQVDHVLVTIDGTDLTDTINGNYTYQLIGVSGEPLTDLDVVCSEETIYVTYPIWATAEIGLDVKFVAGGGVSVDDITYTMTADHITVAGTKDAVESITSGSITLATINLAAVNDGEELTYTIPLADELTNISGITEVTVTLDLPDDLVTKTIDVTEISCIKVPDGWTAKVITQILSVTVRGREYLMDELTADYLRAVADLKDINAAAGQYTVPVKIYLDSIGSVDEIGIMGDYKVVVSLSEEQIEQE